VHRRIREPEAAIREFVEADDDAASCGGYAPIVNTPMFPIQRRSLTCPLTARSFDRAIARAMGPRFVPRAGNNRTPESS
jgi:hypothetical protein